MLWRRCYPTGYQETLNCAGYNHNWVKVYHYEDDVAPLLPKGTVVRVTAWYDNTTANPRVADPRNWKGWGSRSIDDMLFLLSTGRLADGPGVRRGWPPPERRRHPPRRARQAGGNQD